MASGWTSYIVKDTQGETIMIADGPAGDEKFMQILRMQMRMCVGDVEYTVEELKPQAPAEEEGTGGSPPKE